MKLSEAIRLGAMMKPQHFDTESWFTTKKVDRDSGFLKLLGLRRSVECSCVMGAAIEGANLDDEMLQGENGWPQKWRLKQKIACPQCGVSNNASAGFDLRLYDVLTHLNDHHRWTREEIADWVESIENAQTAPVATQQEAHQC